jgi:hypothetical protein
MPEPRPIDGFKFGMTIYYGGDKDSIRLPHKFTDVVDKKMNQVLLGPAGAWQCHWLLDHGATGQDASVSWAHWPGLPDRDPFFIRVLTQID